MTATPSTTKRALRFVTRVLLVLLAVLLVFGFLLWREPIWLGMRVMQLGLYRAGLHSRSIVIDGNRIHYFEGGAGRTVVLIHGLASQALRDWSRLGPALVKAGYHVYALDLLGFGESAKPRNATYSIEEQARLVESFLNAQNLSEVTLGGFSMGGWVAATVALDQPQHVSRLMLFDSGGLMFTPTFDSRLFTPETNEQVDHFMAYIGESEPTPNFVKADLIRMLKGNAWVVQRAWASMFAGKDLLDARFSSLRMPVLIVWGQQDKMTPLALGEAMHKATPQSVLAIYDGCGHIAPVACAGRIAPTMLKFLSDAGLPAGQTIFVPGR